MYRFGTDIVLTSIIDNWDSYYVDRVGAVLDGTWESQDTWWGLTVDGQGGPVGMVEMGDYTNLSDELVAAAEALEADLANGVRHSFDGPIYGQDGELLVVEGERYDDGVLLGMNFFVQGVNGSVPE